MLKIPTKELNKVINFVNFTTGIESVTNNKKLFRQNSILNVPIFLTLKVLMKM